MCIRDSSELGDDRVLVRRVPVAAEAEIADAVPVSYTHLVLPFCIQDGTIITAMRTSAVAGLQAKYCAPSDTDTATLIGAGVIGRTMILSLIHILLDFILAVKHGDTKAPRCYRIRPKAI